jgi:hypothetical protein
MKYSIILLKYLYILAICLIIYYILNIYIIKLYHDYYSKKLLRLLKTYEFNKKIRKGVNLDGGYIIGDINENYDCYISCGISDEESFSRDFIETYNMKKENSFAFDGTISDYPYEYTNKITFYKKNISNYNDETNTDLQFLIDKYNNIFLKMDIEGGEYPWLLSINEDSLKKFKQIIIEFHGITNNDYNYNIKDKLKCFEKLSNTHYLIHVHGNNNSNIDNNIPTVLELTYINKNYFSSTPNLNKQKLPIDNLDFPNNINLQDYNLNMYPFVN